MDLVSDQQSYGYTTRFHLGVSVRELVIGVSESGIPMFIIHSARTMFAGF